MEQGESEDNAGGRCQSVWVGVDQVRRGLASVIQGMC
jgi:hypothetical protein